MPVAAWGAEPFVVVLDAGHGGHDPGTIGRKAKEKDINLGVVLKLGGLIEKNDKDVKVVYTRKGDYFKTLQERSNIANNAKGSLFISVHVNSVDKKARNRTTIHGAATYTLGLHRSAENLAVAKRENAVMMLEDDYSERYCGFDPNSTESYIIFELNQNKHLDQSIDFAGRVQKELHSTASRTDNGVRQAGFWVLAKTGMPAVLVELDFICNPTSEAFMASESGQKKLAQAIYNAFKDYKRSYDIASGKKNEKKSDEKSRNTKVDVESTPLASAAVPSGDADASSVQSGVSASGKRCYRVQFMTSPSRVANGSTKLKGVSDYVEYRDGKLWKYTSPDLPDMQAARRSLAQLRKKFPDAFIITVVDGQRVR
ncbi:N-acetylmuramoyl-L-alanine amidase family protein [Muribaculum intestinale]|uniref:N-acetylmuramoyl-L-alanine amidase family protein n=1 Tax=Muribaculum intestinale TaxID=1796646 RepID=UPI001371ED72|nr:N-acetylmuramoyl-L-alanine amidase [Muribaculum intestinale]MCX4369382.1 N-acetylmuramoyl-L-alanine amidase [Duncaniella sp.]MYM11318.1 N-acetylmuramoyl-L-alanine amidase [Muribaculum intestinale]